MDDLHMPTIGKDVIESLTIGMYENCHFIFREYIQNAADQIDKAIKENLITKEDASIHIQIDATNNTIIIEDNATGIESSKVLPILRNIATSTKERGKDKGFRGIGRLGGLAYCESLYFETSFKGECTKSVMRWDAKLLKEIINNRKEKELATDVIKQVTEVNVEKEDENKHYFKVILEGVKNNDLLNRKEVEEYIRMVAPVPFHNRFILKAKIYEQLAKEGLHLDEYNIFINGDPLTKSYSSTIYQILGKDKVRADEIFDIHFFREFNNSGELLFWGWYGVSNFEKQIEAINTARGIRLRKNNIQIGSDYTLVKLHREQRGNYYFFGEVHAFHPDLIPNSRRDYFSENSACHLFEEKLKDIFHTELHKLYYEANKIKNAQKDIQELAKVQTEFEQKQKEGFINKEERQELLRKIEDKRVKAEDAKKKLEKIKTNHRTQESPVAKIYERIVKPVETESFNSKVINDTKTPTFRTDKLSKLDKEKRKFLSRIFDIIQVNLPKDMASNLMDKIEEEFK